MYELKLTFQELNALLTVIIPRIKEITAKEIDEEVSKDRPNSTALESYKDLFENAVSINDKFRNYLYEQDEPILGKKLIPKS